MINYQITSSDEKGLSFVISGQGETHRVIIPGEMLDDAVSNDASKAEREAWVEENIEEIVKAAEAKKSGGITREPFSRIVVREEN